jgi:hypothetical protein
VQLGSWAPDLPEYGHGNLVTARNCYSTSLGYAPVKALSSVTAAMGETWSGAAAFTAYDGTKVLLAGTAAHLYTLTTSAATSILTVSSGKPWYFAQFGNFVIGVNGDTPQKYTITANTIAALGGSPPDASMVAIVRDQVFLAGDPAAGNTVTWSGLNDCTGWTIGTNQCDNQQIPDGGLITGLVGGEYGLVFQAGAIHIFEYVGTPLIYTRRKISDGIGALCQGVIAQSGKRVFFLDRSGFYQLLDGQLSPIGKQQTQTGLVELVDRTFFETYSVAQIEAQCHATVDPARQLVVWSMPDRLWVYNWGTGKWSDIYQPGIVGVAQGQTSAVTLEDIAVLYPSIEDVPVSFDDPLWRGGDPMLLVAMNDFTLASFGGSQNMEAQFRLPKMEAFKGFGAYVHNSRIDTDATNGVTLQIDSSPTLGAAQTTVISTDLRANGDTPIRCHGRYHQPQITIAQGTEWSFIEGLAIEATQGGRL